MRRSKSWLPLGFLLVSVPPLLSTAFAEAVVFTNNTLIAAGNLTYEGSDLVAQGCTVTVQGGHAFGSVLIQSNAVVDSSAPDLGMQALSLHRGTLRLAGGSLLTVSNTITFVTNSLILCQGSATATTNVSGQWVGAGATIVASNVTVDATSAISADGQGYLGATAIPAVGAGPGGGYAGADAGGGSHGGLGGSRAAPVHGSATVPLDLGSGGATWDGGDAGGNGGGAIRLTVLDTLNLAGAIRANGSSGVGDGGGGAGGSLHLTVGTLTGAGSLKANGGNGGNLTSAGGGGGGRVAVYCGNRSGFSGVAGCTASGGTGRNYGQTGTFGFFDTSVTPPNLDVYQAMALSGATAVYQGVTVHDSARLTLGTNFTLTAATLQTDTNVTVTVGGGATLNLSSGLAVGSNSTVVCQSVGNTSTNVSGQWVGVGVAINASNVTVAATGKISADGQGYVGTSVNNGTGLGPGRSASYSGGSHGGLGGYGDNSGARGAIYGTALQPTELGSSGGAYNGNISGAGGGAIRLAVSGALTLHGTVSANGASGVSHAGAGSGGSLWVTAATLTGSGVFQTRGGNCATASGGAGGGGRIAVYYADGGGFSGFASSTAAGGTGWQSGSKGSVVFLDTSVSGMALSVYENYVLQTSSAVFAALNAYPGATVTLPGGTQLGLTQSLSVATNATVYCLGLNNTSTNASGQWVGTGVTIAASNVTVAAGGKISADGQGYVGTSVNNGTGLGPGRSASYSGGSYGGLGGYGDNWGARGAIYGTVLQPTDLGSSGGAYNGNISGAGGGAVRLELTGTLTLNGTVSANGASGVSHSGGGAGGSLWVTAATLTGSGVFQARGGNCATVNGGAGGGGRIAVYYADGGGFGGFAGSTAVGGTGWQANGAAGNGGKGTVLFMDTSTSSSVLNVYENLELQGTALVFRAVNVYSGAALTLPGGAVMDVGDLWVASNATLTCQGLNTATTNANGQWVGLGVTINASNLTVAAGGNISADGQGYVGGQVGWARGSGPGGGSYTSSGSSWYAGGGGHGGNGGSSLYGGTKGSTYGLALTPAELGSGGSADLNASHLGGPGGGALRLSIQGVLTNSGTISANGRAGVNGTGGGGGSGGSIWVTTATLVGNGRFTVNGGDQLHVYGAGGGGGRIAVYYGEGGGFSGYAASTASAGTSYSAATVGTVLFLDTSLPNHYLRVFQNYTVQGTALTFGAMDVFTNATVTIPGGTTLNVDRTLWVGSNATVTCQGLNTTTTNANGQWAGVGVTINASNLTVAAGAKITADRQGYVGGQTGWAPGAGPGGGIYTSSGSSWYAGGGGYGGSGGSSYYGGTKGSAYGLALTPAELGSGGSADVNGSHLGGPGGGAVRLSIQSAFTNNGLVSANGGTVVNGNGGGAGSGGSIWVTTATLAGSGRFTANGGDQLHGYGPGGGGGRIAVYYGEGGAFGGYTNSTANAGTSYSAATVGTAMFVDTSVPDNALHVYQNGLLQGAGATYSAVTVYRAGTLSMVSNLVLNAQTLSTQTGATVTVGGGATVNVGDALLQTNATWLCQSANNSSTNASGQWVGAGVTINASNLTVEAGAKISADGQGYVGWQADGVHGCGPGTSARVDDISPGAGYGGAGGYDRRGRPGGGTYGSPATPMDLGSGAPPDERAWGGSGGGAIRLNVTGTLNHRGTISANGGNSSNAGSCESGAGSGGSLWVTARELKGPGVFKADGGTPGSTYWGGAGGGGRVAVYYATNSGFVGFAASTANGGGGDQPGSKGTVGFFGTADGVLDVYQNLTLPGTSANYDTVSVHDGAALTLGTNFLLSAQGMNIGTGATLSVGGGSRLSIGTVLQVASNGQLVCQGRDTRTRVGDVWAGVGVTLDVDTLIVDAGGKITADAQGYVGGQSAGAAGAGPGGGRWSGSTWRSGGGGYGGPGGLSINGGIPGRINGSMFSQPDLGSGGSADDTGSQWGGAGGGALRLNVRTSLINNGVISANGGSVTSGNQGGGGSGGSVWVYAPDLVGAGWYKANGGNQIHGYAAGGGGGRVAFHLDSLSTPLNVQCLGGTSNAGSTGDVRGSGGGSVVVVYSNALNVAQTNLTVTGGSGGSAGAVVVRRDSDSDGLGDLSETTFWHTDTALADTDGDGVPDAYEASHGTDPTNATMFPTTLAGRILYSGSQTGVVWATARNVAVTNKALRTSGTAYVNVGDKASLRITNAITVSAWINLADATGDQPIVDKSGNGKCSYWFGVYNYRFGLLIGTGAGYGLWARSSGSVTTGEWTHVASTWDGTNWRSYQNGELVASGTYTGPMLTSTAPVQIGQNSEYASARFNGLIDEVRIWHRALTADEIQAGMFVKPTGTEPNLAGYWNFDAGTATDLTPNANHGTLLNGAVVVTNDLWGVGSYRTRLPTVPADYEITDLPTPGNYTVSCFRDFNLNAAPDFWESQASYAANPVQVTNAVTGIDMTLAVVVPPTAQAGGPYTVDEFSGNAYAGGWTVALDGSASADTVSGSTLLSYAWDLGTDGFDGTAVDSNKWVLGASGVSQSNAVVVTGNGSWGARYFFGKDTCPRAAGMALEVKVKFTAGESMVGFKNTTADYSYTQMPYALYFNNYGIAVHEDGTSRGWSGWPYAYDTWYDVRIELKETQGARYYYRRTGDSAWNLIYDSTYSAATVFRRGITVASGTCTIDDLRELTAGKTPTYRLYDVGTRPVTLIVTDPTGLSATNSSSVTTVRNAFPAAHLTPSTQIQYESNAVDRVWTFPFAATNSVDDHGGTTNGIYKYEWDWEYDGLFDAATNTGAVTTHTWTNAGTYTVALRVTDHVLQSSVDVATLTVIDGTQPTARPGGPYAFDEFTGNASTGAWNVVVSGTNSSDNESNVVQYRWNLGTDTFDGTNLNPWKWVYSATGVSQSNRVSLTGTGTWGQRYLFSTDTYPRVRGAAFEAKCKFDVLGHAMVGFKNANTTYSYNQMPYAIYLYNNGTIQIYEDGTSRGTVGNYATGVWYKVRIELKAAAGAAYYMQTNGATAWTLLYDSSYGSATSFRRGVDVYTSTFSIDDVEELAGGVTTAPYRLYETGTRPVTLTVWDQAQNTHSAATTVTLSPNQPPVAQTGGDKYGTEVNCVGGLWSFVFSAAASTDDHGIYRYEWDWNYDGGIGFRPSGDVGVSVTRQFALSQLGTNTIAVRVTDHLLQSTVSSARVILSRGQSPVANAGGPYTTQLGSWLSLDGSASSDDNEVAQYVWDFGDGTTGTGATPQHRYNQTNDYRVTLVVYDTCNQASSMATTSVQVISGVAPVADAGGPYSGAAGGPPAYFDGRNSHDGAGSPQGIAKYIWDADISVNSDGAGGADDDMDLGGATPFYTYATAGAYTAKLTVVDGMNQSNTAYAAVTIVTNLAPHVICVPYHGNTNSFHPTYSGRAITLKGIVRDAGTLTYSWDFGDGSSTTTVAAVANKYAIQATHSYTGSIGKTYSARLTVWDSTGLSGSAAYLVGMVESNLETRAQIAVDEGLWWLHKDQIKTNGRWSNYSYGSYYASTDASAIQAFEINGHRMDGWPKADPYVETVDKGFRDLFTLLRTNTITSVVVSSLAPQVSSDVVTLSGTESIGGGAVKSSSVLPPVNASILPPNTYDLNGNGRGIDVSSDRKTYELGMVMDALASSQARNAIAITGPVGVKGSTFYDLLTDMADTYIAGQNHSGSGRGGWRYTWNTGDADNSISQWGAIGLRAAEESFGITCPQAVKTDNQLWLNTSWNGSTFGYTSTAYADATYSWYSTTPSAMVQMSMDGIQTTNTMWRQTEYFIADNWSVYGSSGYNYYALYAMVKALRLARPMPVVHLQRNSLDWYNDPVQGVKQRVAGEQLADGSWDKGWSPVSSAGRDLSTSWAIVMLTPTLFTQPPRAVVTAPAVWGYGIPLQLTAEDSFSVDSSKAIVKYMWDFDNDGNFDLITSSATDPGAVWTWPDPHPAVTGDVPAQVTVRLKVVDDDDPPQSDETFRTLILAEPPHAPYAHATVPPTASAGVLVTLSASGSFDIDPTDVITQYQWDFNNDDVPDVVTNAAVILQRFAVPGRQTVALRVVDNGVMNYDVRLTSEWDYATCQVGENHAPVANLGGPYTAYEGRSVVLDATASSDADGNPLLYAWDLDSDGVVDATSAVVTNTWMVPGTATVWLAISDTALSNGVSTTFPVLAVNHAPSFTKGADPTVDEDSGAYSAPAWAGSISRGPSHEAWQTLAFVCSNNAPTLFGVPPSVSTDGSLTFTPAPGANGIATVNIHLQDNGGTAYGGVDRSPVQTFHILMNAVNDAPVMAPANPIMAPLTEDDVGHPGTTVASLVGATISDADVGAVQGVAIFSDIAENGNWQYSTDAGASWAGVGTVSLNAALLLRSQDRIRYLPDTRNGTTASFSYYAWDRTSGSPASKQNVASRGGASAYSVVSDTASVVVSSLNDAPLLMVSTNRVMDERTTLTVTNVATDVDLPADTLTFELLVGPDGMTLDADSGVLVWTPSEAQGPSINPVTVRVYDDGSPVLATTNSFTVTVAEVNVAPVLTVPPDQTLDELTTLAVTNSATDANIPANTLKFELLAGPVGMTLGTNTGAIAWTPAEAQGPSTNTVTVRVCDNGSPLLAATNSFTVTVNDVNSVPILTVPTDQSIDKLTTLNVAVSAADTDVPVNTLQLELLAAPEGLTFDTGTGAIEWTPSELQGPSTNTVTVRVRDDGTPLLAATNSFTVTVSGHLSPLDIDLLNGVPQFRWNVVSPRDYQIQYKDDLAETTWHDLGDAVPSTGGRLVTEDETVPAASNRFYRAMLLYGP